MGELLKVHGRGKCHICGKPKKDVGAGYCSYPHAMIPVAPVDEDAPDGFWSWGPPTTLQTASLAVPLSETPASPAQSSERTQG